MTTVTQKQISELFVYHLDGYLLWAVNRKRARIGNKVGTVHPCGYLRTRVNEKLELNHRLIYILHHGCVPIFVDHINGNKLNNKIENLRLASNVENQQNAKLKVTNTSGFKNVSFCPQTKKWAVKIRVCGKHKTIGRYEDVELANLVAQESRAKYHGEFARNY